MSGRGPLIDFIIQNRSVLLNIDFMREIFMIPDRLYAESKTDGITGSEFYLNTQSPLYDNKLFVFGNTFYAIEKWVRLYNNKVEDKVYSVIAKSTGIPVPQNTLPLSTPQDKFILRANEIENYPEGPDIETTLGRFIANYLFLAYPFGNRISYLNEEFTDKKLESRIAIPLINGDITTSQVKDRYVNTLSLFGQANDIICPNISEKTITIPKHIHDLRKKLVEENKDALEAGDASVMSDIEQKLISEYKTYLKGDPSLHFLLKSKHFNVTLKKLFLTQGITEKFGEPGKYVFIDQPMGSGWKIENLPDIFNEVRSGSYARAIETANGGVIAKLILRVLQDTRISISDCGTKSGEKVIGTKQQLKDFEWNYVVESDGATILISDDTYDQFVGREVTIRTPGYCQAESGYCSKCFGKIFETLGQKAFGPIANDVGRHQLNASLKRMHGTSHSSVDVSDINKFII
jgi:hypothetical protein